MLKHVATEVESDCMLILNLCPLSGTANKIVRVIYILYFIPYFFSSQVRMAEFVQVKCEHHVTALCTIRYYRDRDFF
jgi:hypothetical protein